MRINRTVVCKGYRLRLGFGGAHVGFIWRISCAHLLLRRSGCCSPPCRHYQPSALPLLLLALSPTLAHYSLSFQYPTSGGSIVVFVLFVVLCLLPFAVWVLSCGCRVCVSSPFHLHTHIPLHRVFMPPTHSHILTPNFAPSTLRFRGCNQVPI